MHSFSVFAARADEKIKKDTASSSGVSLTFDEQHRRAKALESIDKDEFFQNEFVSSREKVNKYFAIFITFSYDK